jgi:hypothetical protein
MASKRHQRNRECTGKVRYKTSTGAFIARKQMVGKHGGFFDVYHCKWCKGYHIGHRRAATWRALSF